MPQERTRRLGNVVLHLVSDGLCWMDGGGIFGIVPKTMWQRLTEVDEQNRVQMELNCLLIETCDEVILVDTGFGPKMPPKQRDFYRIPESRLLANLAELGYAPEDIHYVVNTHLHPDHCGGNTRIEDGTPVPTFPKAVYVIQEQEWHDATHPNERTKSVYLPENLLPIQKADQLRLIRGETQITEEVRCLPTPGHTFGHQSVVVQSEGQTAMYVGDTAHWALNMERLAWTTAFEVQPLQTVDVKRSIQKWALARNALLVFGHDPKTFWGHLFEAEGAVRVTSA
jgi:glyoxylase-like metal-dependent hydrolase (beta-lactamase superfamily II)